MSITNNQRVRAALKENKVAQWQLADRLYVSEITLSRWMRHELPREKQDAMIDLIIDIAKQEVA